MESDGLAIAGAMRLSPRAVRVCFGIITFLSFYFAMEEGRRGLAQCPKSQIPNAKQGTGVRSTSEHGTAVLTFLSGMNGNPF